MADLSLVWILVIAAITIVTYWLACTVLKGRRKRMPLLAMLGTTFVYSGVGIAYERVDKGNIWYYWLFIAVFTLAYCVFLTVRIKSLAGDRRPRLVDDIGLWSGQTARKCYIALMVVYFALRFITMVYPVNHLANLKIVYDSSNNAANLTGENVTVFSTMAAILSPFFYVGMYYFAKKVRTVALLLGLNALITLIVTGYLSRHNIVTIAAICFLLYVNADLGGQPVSHTKKTFRLLLFAVIIVPVLVDVLVILMNVRTEGGPTYTSGTMLKSEIGYPLRYEYIQSVSPLVEYKDFFLQILDSFVPILPTPGYYMDLNVTFSKAILGVDVKHRYFSILLPSVLGESFLIFGKYFFWIHAIVLAFFVSLIYKVVGENKHLAILWYHYLICILKTGRAGYVEVMQGVWLNYVVFFLAILLIRLMDNSWRRKNVNPNRQIN